MTTASNSKQSLHAVSVVPEFVRNASWKMVVRAVMAEYKSFETGSLENKNREMTARIFLILED